MQSFTLKTHDAQRQSSPIVRGMLTEVVYSTMAGVLALKDQILMKVPCLQTAAGFKTSSVAGWSATRDELVLTP